MVVPSAVLEDALAPTLSRLKLPPRPISLLTGIEARRAWAPGTRLADAGAEAVRGVLARAGVAPERVGLLLSTSVSREGLEPSLASSIHGFSGLPASCQGLDVGNACLGFLNGIDIAGRFLETRAVDVAVVVAVEDAGPVVDRTLARLSRPETTAADVWAHFATLTLGSMAVAMVLVRDEDSRTTHRVHGSVSLADTTNNHLCRGDHEGMVTDSTALLKAGVALARRAWTRAAETLPDWSPEGLDAYVCHQVGRAHLSALAEALGIPLARCVPTYPTHGNVGPAAVPFTLARGVAHGAVREGHRVALMGIGSGLNVCMMGITW